MTAITQTSQAYSAYRAYSAIRHVAEGDRPAALRSFLEGESSNASLRGMMDIDGYVYATIDRANLGGENTTLHGARLPTPLFAEPSVKPLPHMRPTSLAGSEQPHRHAEVHRPSR